MIIKLNVSSLEAGNLFLLNGSLGSQVFAWLLELGEEVLNSL